MSSTTKAARKAAKQAEKKVGKATDSAQDQLAELADLASERAHELAEKLRESEALAKAQAKGHELADLASVKGHELAELAKAKWTEAEVEERAAALAKQIRETDAAKEASRKAKELTDTSLATVGSWLVAGKAADKLGVTRKPRIPGWLWALLGAALGFAAAKLVGGGSGHDVRDDLTAAAERLAQAAPHPAGTVLADTIRTTLQGDPRTADLQELNINVAEGTVFVRGSLPSGIDSEAVREVIAAVPGVEDVDLQLTPAI
jgi:hypothetical protein